MNKLFAKLNYGHCSTAITKWKLTVLSKVESKKGAVFNDLSNEQQKFEKWVSECKDTNNMRCLLYFAERNAKNIFSGWVNVVRHI